MKPLRVMVSGMGGGWGFFELFDAARLEHMDLILFHGA